MKSAILILSMLSFMTVSKAQNMYLGNWEGKLDVGAASLRLAFHITDTAGQLSGTMDSPDQGVTGVPCDKVDVHDGAVSISLMHGAATYTARLAGDDTLNGSFAQSGRTFPLSLTRGTATPLNRPQTPLPPFPYKSEDVIYHNTGNSTQYGATITIPQGAGPFPALLLITGSGQQNRDEELFGHKPFAVIADYLTRRGYIVMRVDDRAIGQSTGTFKGATTADFADDVRVSFAYLKSRQEVDKKRIGLAGHSEGGIIAPMVAKQDKDVAFIIMLAGPGIKNSELMKLQNTAVLEQSGMPASAVAAYAPLYGQIIDTSLTSTSAAGLLSATTQLVNIWRANTPSDMVAATTGATDEAGVNRFASRMAQSLSDPWFHYFLSYDPAPALRQLHCKVLALNGVKDIQVVAGPNLDGIRAALAQSHSPKYDVIELKGLNHLFQQCNTCTVAEYGQLEQTISPDALATIGDWLDKNVKGQ